MTRKSNAAYWAAGALLLLSSAAGVASGQSPAMSGTAARPTSGAPQKTRPPLSLPKPSDKPPADATRSNNAARTVTALAVVMGTFFLIYWLQRKRTADTAPGPLPSAAVELLGTMPLTEQHSATLVRVGGKLLLLAVAAQQVSTLTEISDPREVSELLNACQLEDPRSTGRGWTSTRPTGGVR
jgi:flagellar biogenesis protein FliO